MNTFQLRQATNGSVSYFDILIDGKPLAAYFAGRHGALPELISPLGPVELELAPYCRKQFERLLLEREPDCPSGRNSILVCQLCGDLGCGAYTAKFQREDDRIRWTAFGYENNYDPESVELEAYKDMPDFVFSWDAYEAELRRYFGASHK
jgi:hypothetical protein